MTLARNQVFRFVVLKYARSFVPFRTFQGSSEVSKSEKLVTNQLSGLSSPKHSESASEAEEEVDMWNFEAPSGPEWGGPRGYEPTKFGDWSKNCRVSDF